MMWMRVRDSKMNECFIWIVFLIHFGKEKFMVLVRVESLNEGIIQSEIKLVNYSFIKL